MKIFEKYNEYYIDSTFMKSPRNYYQTLNLICYCEETKIYISIL